MTGGYAEPSLIIKCGWWDNVQKELVNYRNHVMAINPGPCATLIGDKLHETPHFGLIKYTVAGENVWRTRTFGEFYRLQPDPAPIIAVLRQLFGPATAPWYQLGAEQRRGEYLNQFYEERLLRGGPSSTAVWTDVGRAVTRTIEQARRQGLRASIRPFAAMGTCTAKMCWSRRMAMSG
jgi:hypothetical protein